MCINLLYLPLFNFAYLFFLSFLSFLYSQHFVSFIFIALFPNWQLALVLFSSFCFNQFCLGRYNFWFPLFARSIYYTLFLLHWSDFAYGCICVCVYSVTLFIVAIHLCLYIGLLQFSGVFLFFSFFVSSSIFLLFFIILNFKKPIILFYIYFFVCLSYCSFPHAV